MMKTKTNLKVEPHSTMGIRGRSSKMGETYEHIVVGPTTDRIAACNACGRCGLQLFDLQISGNGYQTLVTKLCSDCIKDLRGKLFPFSA